MLELSVLMPAFNSAKYIKEAIDSILNQSFLDFQLIIINDGSTDETERIILAYNDKRIKYYKNESNKGLTFTRNRLISLANTKYIAFLDSDDIALPDRLSKQYSYMEKNIDIDLLSGSMIAFNDNNKKQYNVFKFNLDKNQLPANLLFFNPISTSTVIIRRKSIYDLTFRESYPPCEDYDMWTRLLLKSNGVVLKKYFAKYRLHDNNISKLKFDVANQNRDRIVSNQLDVYFKNILTENQKTLHFFLVDMNLKCNMDKIKDIYAYTIYLLKLNKELNIFNDNALKSIIFERILKRLLRLEQYNFNTIQYLFNFNHILKPKFSLLNSVKQFIIIFNSLLTKKIL
jgi:glycosyltransferase involved in cell wall biosynthesis